MEALGNREFGSIYINKENIAMTVISKGWAKVITQLIILILNFKN